MKMRRRRNTFKSPPDAFHSRCPPGQRVRVLRDKSMSHAVSTTVVLPWCNTRGPGVSRFRRERDDAWFDIDAVACAKFRAIAEYVIFISSRTAFCHVRTRSRLQVRASADLHSHLNKTRTLSPRRFLAIFERVSPTRGLGFWTINYIFKRLSHSLIDPSRRASLEIDLENDSRNFDAGCTCASFARQLRPWHQRTAMLGRTREQSMSPPLLYLAVCLPQRRYKFIPSARYRSPPRVRRIHVRANPPRGAGGPADLPWSMLWSASSSAWKRTPSMEEDSRLIFPATFRPALRRILDRAERQQRWRRGPTRRGATWPAGAIGARSPRVRWTSQSRRGKPRQRGASRASASSREAAGHEPPTPKRHFLPATSCSYHSPTCHRVSRFSGSYLAVVAEPGGPEDPPPRRASLPERLLFRAPTMTTTTASWQTRLARGRLRRCHSAWLTDTADCNCPASSRASRTARFAVRHATAHDTRRRAAINTSRLLGVCAIASPTRGGGRVPDVGPRH